MKILKNFNAHSSQVELVDLNGKILILKTSDPEEINNEKTFLQAFKDNGLPTLEVVVNPELKKNQILLEYIEGSKIAVTETLGDFFRWGQAVRRMHDIHFDHAFRILSDGSREQLNWNQFLLQMLENSIKEQKDKKSDISESDLKRIESFAKDKIRTLNVLLPFSMIHGDIHTGNTLDKDGEVVIYDKSSEIFAGHSLYDMVVMLGHHPNGTYIQTDDPAHKDDKALMGSFIKGYGINFLEDRETLDLYMLIKGLSRYPNQFEVHLKDIFMNILS